MFIKKLINEMSDFEKKLFLLLPVVILTAMAVFGIQHGWDELLLDLILYFYLTIAAIIMFFLVKKSTFILGRFNLSLMGHSSFDEVPKKAILMRYRITMYGSVIAAGVAFIGGTFYAADLVMIFSWSLLGITVASKRLVQEISEMKEKNNTPMY